MKLEEIHEHWAQDSALPVTMLERSISNVPTIHSKYLRYMSDEKMTLRKLEEERKVLVKMKYEYYQGILPEEDLKANGWEPFRQRILKSDLGMHIDADQDIIKTNLRIAAQQEKVDVLIQIIKHISNRGFLIKNVIDWERFKSGA
jgi:hypothetical protein